MAAIAQSQEWQNLCKHVDDIEQVHLKDLLQHDQRTEAMIREQNGIYFDFSRQNATPETIKVR